MSATFPAKNYITGPIDTPSIFIIYVDMLIYYSPPHANVLSKCSCKLICGVKTMETHDNER